VYVLHTTTATKTVDGISGTCIVLQAGLWKQWAKNYFKKVSNILDTAFKTLETSGQSLNNFGIIATKCTMEANNGAMDQKSKLSNQFLFAKLLSNKTIVIVKKDFLEIYAMIITLWFPPVFTTGGQWLQLYEITALVRFKIAPAFAQTGLKC